MTNKKILIKSLLKEQKSSLEIASLDKINQLFIKGELSFDYDSRWNIEGKEYTSYRDFQLSLNLDRLQEEKKDCIIYISQNGSHLNFEYVYENGSIIPNRVYIKEKSELKQEAEEHWKEFMKK